jgi:hypothetical protein
MREGSYLYNRYRNLRDRRQFGKLLDDLCNSEAEESLNQWMIDVMREYGDELFRRHMDEPSLAKLIENIYMLPEPKPCWGNKMLRIEECPQLLRLWPNAKVVILIRDPRAVHASQAKFLNTRIKYSTIYWNLHSRWTRLNATDPDRYLIVRYEDFVQNALPELERILKLVGLWDPKVAEEMLAKYPPRPESLTKWRKSLDSEKVALIESLCFEEMQHWSYTPEVADRPKRMGTFAKGLETLLEYRPFVPLNPAWWFRKRIFSRFLRTLRG